MIQVLLEQNQEVSSLSVLCLLFSLDSSNGSNSGLQVAVAVVVTASRRAVSQHQPEEPVTPLGRSA